MFVTYLLHLIHIILLLIASFCIVTTDSYHTKFYGYLSDDTIAYTKVTIPPTAQRVTVNIWCEPIHGSMTQRRVLLGRNRVPTIGSYDSIMELPKNGKVVSIVDDSPVETVLYIGLWGGTLLHSYRYFGGFPVYTAVGVVVDMVQCDSSVQVGLACTLQPHLATLDTSSYFRGDDGSGEEVILQQSSGSAHTELKLGSRVIRRIKLDPGLEKITFTVQLNTHSIDDQIETLCNAIVERNSSVNTLRLQGQLYLERSPDIVHDVFSDTIINISHTCTENAMSGEIYLSLNDLVYVVVKPIPGYWRLVVSLNLITSSGVSSSEGDYMETRWPDSVRDDDVVKSDEVHDEGMGCIYKHAEDFQSRFSVESNGNCQPSLLKSIQSASRYSQEDGNSIVGIQSEDNKVSFNVTIETVTTLCSPGFTSSSSGECSTIINDMDSYTFQNTATHQYMLNSDTYKLTIPRPEPHQIIDSSNETDTGLYDVMLRGSLGGMNFSPAGGSMSVEVILVPVDGGAVRDVQGVRDGFSVFLQTGGLAHGNTFGESSRQDATLLNEANIFSENLFELHPSDADDEIVNLNFVKYRWVFHKPMLTEISQHQGGDYFLYFYLVSNNQSSPRVEVGSSSTTPYKINLRVVFSPCLESTCKHGECVITDDGLLISSCSCKYPFAGEYCDELAESYWIYILKVSVLVLSNFAVFPGAILAFYKEVPVLGCILTSSGVASIFYHLCDSDIWCIGGLSFGSLQVWDVLFATSSMSAVLIHHYPLHRETRSALSLALLAFLVSPVSNSPTDAICIILAMGGGAALFILFWFRFWLMSRYGNNHTPSILKRYLEVTGLEVDSCNDDALTRRNSAEALMEDDRRENSVTAVDRGGLSHPEHFYDDVKDHSSSRFLLSHFDQFFSCHHQCANIFLTLLGFTMVIIAFACYIFQNRETYWIVHSVWHILAMGSTFLFIKNKDSVVRLIANYLSQSEMLPQQDHDAL